MQVVNKNNQTYITVCRRCGTKLRIGIEDLHFGVFDVSIKCPICRQKYILRDDQLALFGLYRVDDDDIF